MEPGDLVRGDRGFCSYVHKALLLGRRLHGVFRIHQKQIVSPFSTCLASTIPFKQPAELNIKQRSFMLIVGLVRLHPERPALGMVESKPSGGLVEKPPLLIGPLLEPGRLEQEAGQLTLPS